MIKGFNNLNRHLHFELALDLVSFALYTNCDSRYRQHCDFGSRIRTLRALITQAKGAYVDARVCVRVTSAVCFSSM